METETLRRLDDRRNLLYAKGDERTGAETAEMERLSEELSELGFARDSKYPHYALFVRTMLQHSELPCAGEQENGQGGCPAVVRRALVFEFPG